MLSSQRALFDIPRDIAYFNCAYFSPNLQAALAAGESGLRRKSAPWTIHLPDFFAEVEAARGAFAALIGAKAGDIAIVPAASYGIATAAANLPLGPGQGIVILRNQFPSNVFAWEEKAAAADGALVRVAQPEDGDWTRDVLAAIDGRIGIVALPHAHWCDGTRLDLVAIGARCRAVGAALVVDGTQSVGALPFDVGAIQPDFLACGGYKWLFCPYTVSFLYVAPHRQEGRPLEANWADRAGAEHGHPWQGGVMGYGEGWQPGARRFDMGERAHFALLPMALVGLRQLAAWTVPAINAYITAINDRLVAETEDLGLRAAPKTHRAGHLLGLTLPGGLPAGFQTRLEAEGVHVSLRGDTIRVSPHLWIDDEDVERFLAVLRRALAG